MSASKYLIFTQENINCTKVAFDKVKIPINGEIKTSLDN